MRRRLAQAAAEQLPVMLGHADVLVVPGQSTRNGGERAERSSTSPPTWRSSASVARRSAFQGKRPSLRNGGGLESPTKKGATTTCRSSGRLSVRNWVCTLPPP